MWKNVLSGDMWRNLSCGEMFPHDRCTIYAVMLHNYIVFVFLQNLSCRNLRCFVAKSVLSQFTRFLCEKKIESKIVLVEKKRQISGMIMV